MGGRGNSNNWHINNNDNEKMTTTTTMALTLSAVVMATSIMSRDTRSLNTTSNQLLQKKFPDKNSPQNNLSWGTIPTPIPSTSRQKNPMRIPKRIKGPWKLDFLVSVANHHRAETVESIVSLSPWRMPPTVNARTSLTPHGETAARHRDNGLNLLNPTTDN